ncbi:serine hydrolase [Cognatiyoonia sp. IB215182]|uniref:serine hydrolase domain-containing protein n=1 Tax=Cognatiyoonia sp. IB215182 TaxID=3097353 RepID=UPI002A176D41|nr:serine hydrolase [Cognatiyoonia sp. IB215182]MDX8350957.1 serine hydrolase [Cognatiyoonia sp. IB215182]
MRKAAKWAGGFILIFTLTLGALAIWKREEVVRLMGVLDLFSEEKIVTNFSNMNAIFLNRPFAMTRIAPSPLPSGQQATLPAAVSDWVAERSVTSLVVLKDGAVVFEEYYQGTAREDVRINWSVSKSYLSALMGIVLAEGAIGSVDDLVVTYAPELAASAYATASIRDVLQMESGVTFDEDYLDFFSDINRMGRVLALGRSMDAFAVAQDESFTAPGTDWQYVSIDTHVLGMVIRGATGRDVHDLMNEKILRPMALEGAPYYLVDGFGTAFVLGGLNMTTRDNARFGQMFANGGRWNGQQIVPATWVDQSTTATANTAPGAIGYGYQWWIPDGSAPGQYLARGIYGQYLYVDRVNDVVIATHGADRAFREAGVQAQNEAMFRLIAESL